MLERRRSPRYLCSHIVDISRQDSDGYVRLGPALLEDLSREGAGVSLESPIAPGETVELMAPGLRAQAVVRYCRVRENDRQLGLEFDVPWRWQPDLWEPDHLFLPTP